MRKISILSLVAVLAATPMMAEAAMDRATKVGIDSQTQQFVKNTNVASTSYVQGAYNALVDEINTDRDAIDAVNSNIAVATKAEGNYVAINTSSSVGENLAALDDKIAELDNDTSANLTSAINALDSTVSTAEDAELAVTVAELDGKLTSVTASINDAAVVESKIADSAVTTAKINDAAVTTAKIADSNVTTAKIANEAVTFDKMNAAAVVTATEGISSDINSASDSALVTEKAVKAAIDTINGNATNLASDLADEVSARKAADNALKNYVDNSTITVYTEWGESTNSAINLTSPSLTLDE